MEKNIFLYFILFNMHVFAGNYSMLACMFTDMQLNICIKVITLAVFITQYKQEVGRRKVTCRTRTDVKGGNPVLSPGF
jgi:hypothetical protein